MKLKIDLSGSIGFELLSSSLSLSLSCRHAFICRCVGLCVAFFMANFCLAPSTEPHSFVGELRQDPLSPQNTNKFLRSNLSHVDSHYGFLCFLYFLCAQFSNSPQDFYVRTLNVQHVDHNPPKKNVIATKPDVSVLTIGEQIKVVENARIHNRVGAMATPEFSIALVR